MRKGRLLPLISLYRRDLYIEKGHAAPKQRSIPISKTLIILDWSGFYGLTPIDF
jgi:hypothetical protein